MICIRTNFAPLLLSLVTPLLLLMHHVDAKISPDDRLRHRFLKHHKSTKSAKCNNLHFSNIFVFGDSISDQGNFASVVDAYPPGFASNGKFAVEYVAESFGLGLEMSNHLIALGMKDPQLITGNNYAVVSGEAAVGHLFNTPTQVGAFMLKHKNSAPSDALYIVMIGANDLLALYDAKYLDGTSKTDDELFQDAKLSGISVVKYTVQPLIDAGAKHIVVVSSPPINSTPFVTMNQPEERALFTARTVSVFDKELARGVNDVKFATGANVMFHSFATTLRIEQLGLQIESPCTIGFVGVKGSIPVILPFNGTTSVPYIWDSECSLPNASGFAWYDELHPSDAVHKFLAQKMINQIKKSKCSKGKSSKGFKGKSPKGSKRKSSKGFKGKS